MNIDRLLKEYGKLYNFLYDHCAELSIDTIISDYCGVFDEAMKKDSVFNTIICKAAKMRGDIFASDRECAAVTLAYRTLERGME